VTGCGLDDQGIGVQRISLLHIVQTGSQRVLGWGRGAFFPEGKWQGYEGDYSPATSAEVMKMWISTSSPAYIFMI
jgi:hypothetical protein